MKRGLLLVGVAGAALLLAQRGPGGRGGRGGAQNDVMYISVPAHDFDIVLGRPEARSVTATVIAYDDSDAYIEFAGRKTPVVALRKGEPTSVVLDGLQPDTAYRYTLVYRKAGANEFARSAEYAFHTQRPPGSAYTVTIQADSHLDSNTEPKVYAMALRDALADAPDFHIDLGDTFMTDKYPAYRDAAAQYLAQRYYFGLLCHSAPLFITLGNHDGEQGRFLIGAPENMATWSNAMRKKYFPNPVQDAFYSGNTARDPVAGELQDYYAWEWGDGLFVVLDPFLYSKQRGGAAGNWDWTLGEAQYRWLQRTLEGSKARYKMIFIHHLVGGAESQRGGVEAAKFYEWGGANADGSEGFAANRPGWEMPIHQMLVKNRVSVVFHGHDHLFAKQDLDGIVYQEVPQPGFPRYESPRSAAEYGYVSGVILGSPGYLRLRVAPEGMKVDFVRPVLAEAETTALHNRDVAYSYTVRPR